MANEECTEENTAVQETGSSDANNQEDLIKHETSIVLEWLRFIRKHKSAFHPFTPAANYVIKSGNGISPRPYSDRDLYEKHSNSHDLGLHAVPDILCSNLDSAIDTTFLIDFKKEVRKFSVLITKSEDCKANLEILGGVSQ
ncbi:unnamed protein product [Mucor hiemalis]